MTPQPPLLVDALGLARLVRAAPTSEAAWALLVERLPRGGGYLAARLLVTTERVDEAAAAVARGRAMVAERRRVGGAVPAAWVARLGDLVVEVVEARWALDDAAHAAATVPGWVELTPGERGVPGDERSWARVARLFARVVEAAGAIGVGEAGMDGVWDRLGGIPPGTSEDAGDLDEIRERCRAAVRWAVGAAHLSEEA